MTWIHAKASGHALGVVPFLLMVSGEVKICARNSGVEHLSRPEGCDLNSGH